jgi:Na+-transporting methylmalonyl-CoA/oxaloacetate decarboxylase gamma subunit
MTSDMELLIVVSPSDLKLGITITIVGLVVVFSSLLILTVIFNQIPKFFKIRLRNKFRKSGKSAVEEDCCPDISGATNAAIAMALYLYFNELHDKEHNVMTIEKVSKRYSPWSSKIYGLRNLNIK